MPEYPEVTVVRKSLSNLVEGVKITNVVLLNTKFIKNATYQEFQEFVKNKTIEKIENVGKFIIFYLSENHRMLCHLRMSGKFYVYKAGDETQANLPHNYVFFTLDNGYIMAYNDARMFGGFEIIDPSDTRSVSEIKNLAELPAFVNVDKLYAKLQRKNISIKSALLDQSLVLGIGNIYVDETLHACKVYPMTKCSKISKEKLAEILTTAQQIMDKSIELGGSSVNTYTSVNGIDGKFQNKLKVYGRGGLICQTCYKVNVAKVKLDFKENGRGTSYCPNCQKEA
ncbi:bifunctional DNA-formamidopyrimidine glycosylase/DNA-(apurinic or apyrimidinic site) lyase [Mycoplasma corogypsi]|uniref:bifunctional DNA-formamidopyrimidine glycosylase/DNA-(apurinic or apyrimidinic site) lyase n=1 Tax=Mycoplasma corogypsi TaxID=2106 RepID=UPI003872A887